MSKENSKLPKAIYGSDKTALKLGEIDIPCYVLEDGRRVLSQSGIQKALGYTGQSGQMLTRLVKEKNNFPAEIVAGVSNPIKFIRNTAGGTLPITNGYEASLFIDICNALIDLKRAGRLNDQQVIFADMADIIVRAVAKVGIIALIDEATGYQEVRERNALQKFLEKFLEDEKGKWIKTFPDEFFEMIFKMKGLTWVTANKGKKPQWIGHWINNYVYSRIAPKVLKELRKLNPKSETGRRKGTHTQWIDIDYGHPKLKEHLNALVLFGKAAGYNENTWKRMVKRALPAYNQHDGSAVQEIDFEEL